MRNNSAVTQANMSYVAQVWSVWFESLARYCVLIPEQSEIRILRPNTMQSYIFWILSMRRFQKKTVTGIKARLASAKVLKAADISTLTPKFVEIALHPVKVPYEDRIFGSRHLPPILGSHSLSGGLHCRNVRSEHEIATPLARSIVMTHR
jgi:hypothetical protein